MALSETKKILVVLLLMIAGSAFGQSTVVVVPPNQPQYPSEGPSAGELIRQINAAKMAQQQQQMMRQQQELLRIQTQQQQVVLENMRKQQASQAAPASPVPTPAFVAGTVHLQDTMSASDFQRAGLQKLTPEELTALNQWLTIQLAAVVQTITAPRAASSAP